MDPSKSNGRGMDTILIVVSDLGPNGAAKQVSLLAPKLACLGKSVYVAGLVPNDFYCGPLQAAGIRVHSLARSSRFDLRTILRLNRAIREVRADAIMAWRRSALRMTALSRAARRWPPIVAADMLYGGPLCWLDRLLLRRADVVVASGQSEHQRFVRAGIAENRISVVPFSIAAARSPDRKSALSSLDLPANARLVACAGIVDSGKGFRDAAWVLNILTFVYPELWLLIIGDGPDRARVQEFARAGGNEAARIRFVDSHTDCTSMLGLAEVVWVLGEHGGRNVALEALAAGRPVVARDRPDLREILSDGETGFLVDGADPHEVARATRRILDDPARRQTFEVNSSRRAQQFQVAAIAEKWVKLLDSTIDPLHRGVNRLP
jgi:glycosyltransferase involved in cell wall biosynthesis